MSGKPETIKKINLNLIYNALMDVQSATRSELAVKTGISLTTVRTILDELHDRQEVVLSHLDESSGGRRAQRYALHPSKNLILSICVNGKNLTYQLVNLNAEVIAARSAIMKQDIESAIMEIVDEYCPNGQLALIAVGMSGIVEGGKVYAGSELNGLVMHSISEQIRQKYRVEVILENDSKAIAYGYANRYLSTHPSVTCPDVNLAYLDFGTRGIGAGFIVDGEILHGARNFAGELGYMPIAEGKTIAQAMLEPMDKEQTLDLLCRVLASIQCMTNPTLIVINGEKFLDGTLNQFQVESTLKSRYLGELSPQLEVVENGGDDYTRGLQALAFFRVRELLPTDNKEETLLD